MRHHRSGGAAVMFAIVAFSFVVAGCSGADAGGAAGVSAPPTDGAPGSFPVTLASKADTVLVDQSLQLVATVPTTAGDEAAASAMWSSSDVAVATVSPSGVVVGVKSGRATITVASRGTSASTIVTVKPSVRKVQFDTDTLAVELNQTAPLSYRVIDSDGNPVDLTLGTHSVQWTSTAPSVVAFSGSASSVTGIALGAADVRLSVDGKTATVRVKVKPRAVASVSISPSPLTASVGGTVQLAATAKDAAGNTLTNRSVAWSTSDAAIATVSANGLMTAIKAGSAVITATVEGKAVNAAVVVTSPVASNPPPPTVSRVVVTLPFSSLAVGGTTQGSAVAYDANGQVITGLTAAWTSSNTTVASVSASGVVKALAAGTVNIAATMGAQAGSTALTVSLAAAPSGTPIYPGQSLQAAVTAAPAGTTFLLKAGTHVRQSVIPKDGDVFDCEPGAVLDGEQVTPYAIGNTDLTRRGVVVRGCVITNYAPTYDWMGAVGNDGAVDWLIENNEVRYSSAVGIRAVVGTRVLNNRVHHNAVDGIGAYKAHGARIEGNEVYENGFKPDGSPATASAAGMKIVGADNIVVRRNTIHDNGSRGLWFDIGGHNVVADSNTVTRNKGAGIWLEITYGGVVRGNTVTSNGTSSGWVGDAGIQVSNSPNVEIVGNTVAGNVNGITGMQASGYPADLGSGPLTLRNLWVHDNSISMSVGHTGVAENVGDPSVFTGWNIRYTNNRYTLNGLSAPFAWAGSWRTVAQWQGYGHDLTGTFTR